MSCWIDYVVVTLGLCFVALATDPFFSENIENRNDPLTLVLGGVLVIIFLIMFPVMYCSLMESSKYQATLGKMLLRLKVVDREGDKILFRKALMRNVPKVLNLLVPPLYFTFIVIGVSKSKQALHDKVAGTFVIRK